ncbi:hypothetical protein ACFQ6N_18675 [Kitasatospora sp. NPDC056446]|uniref:hypothetical protein n=1 Tax=Kitasatospora sp. NPDC056446 TaxID=3345819 RepID=UPI0036D1EABC
MDQPDDYELLATGVWVAGEVVPAIVRIQRPTPPQPLPPLPPLPEWGRCAGTRDCINGECYCAEPMLADFMFRDGDGPDSYGSWGSWEE